jgi:cation:H+ antiporter
MYLKHIYIGKMFELIIWFSILIAGVILMVFASDKAVEHSVFCATIFGMSQFMIGFVLVSIGTDLPEIVNSIVSNSLGHADVNAGDSIGSVLAQLTLVLGILAIYSKPFKIKKKEIIVVGACLFSSLIALAVVVSIGFSRLTAILLILSWLVYIFITRRVTKKFVGKEDYPILPPKGWKHHLTAAALGFIGVAIGSYAVVQSVINLSTALKIPEFLISFFIVGIGTSLPELVVDLIAIRKKAFEVAIGDIIGSCIVDASLSISIGQALFPQPISVQLAETMLLYTLIASIIVISMLVLREKVDRKVGIIFLTIYLLSYLWVAL